MRVVKPSGRTGRRRLRLARPFSGLCRGCGYAGAAFRRWRGECVPGTLSARRCETAALALRQGRRGACRRETALRDGSFRLDRVADIDRRACIWTLGGLLNEDQFGRLLKEARRALESFRDESGESFSTCRRSSSQRPSNNGTKASGFLRAFRCKSPPSRHFLANTLPYLQRLIAVREM